MNVGETVEQRRIVQNECAHYNVRMTVHVFAQRVEYDVRTQLERFLDERENILLIIVKTTVKNAVVYNIVRSTRKIIFFYEIYVNCRRRTPLLLEFQPWGVGGGG